MKVSAPVVAPSVIAIRIHHDMCPFCRSFDPQFPKLIRQVGGGAVLFVTLDLTGKDLQRQSAMMDAALAFKMYGAATFPRWGPSPSLTARANEL